MHVWRPRPGPATLGCAGRLRACRASCARTSCGGGSIRHAPLPHDGGRRAARRHDRPATRARRDRVRPRRRDARLQHLRRGIARDGSPHDCARLHPESGGRPPRARRLGLRPQLRRGRPAERDPAACRKRGPVRGRHGRARRHRPSRDPARVRERRLRSPPPRGRGRGVRPAGGARGRADGVRRRAGLRAEDRAHRHRHDPTRRR